MNKFNEVSLPTGVATLLPHNVKEIIPVFSAEVCSTLFGQSGNRKVIEQIGVKEQSECRGNEA